MYYDTEYFLNKINRKDSSDRNNTRRKLTKKGLKNYLKARKNEEDIVNAFTANFPKQSNSSPLRKCPKPAKILYF